MSNDNNNPGNLEDAQWKAYVQSITTGTKYLRSAWHNNVKPNEINESKMKVGVFEHKGSEAYSSRINGGLDEFGETKVRAHTKDKKNGNKSNSHKIKLKYKEFSSNECIETPMDLINSIGADQNEQFNNRGKITSYFKKKSSQININAICNDTIITPNRLQNSNSKNEADDNRNNHHSSNIVSKLDSNKKNKKLSIHNSILPYEIVPNAYSNLCNPYLLSISLDEKIKDNRRSTLDNYVGRCVAVRREDTQGEAKFLIGRIESINESEESIRVIFFDLNNADTDWEETICFRDIEVLLLEYMFSYLDENDLNSEKAYFIATSKFNSIFFNNEVEAYHCEENPTHYNGFLCSHSFILEEIRKISSSQLNVIQEADIVDNLTAKYFKIINRNLIYFIDRSEFLEVFTNKMRSVNYSSVEQHKITTLASCFKNYDLLSKHVLHEIILTMNINHKTDRRIGLLLAVNNGPNYEGIYMKHYKTGKSQWIYLNDYKLSIRANISKSRAVIDTLLNLKKTEENFYLNLKFSYQTSSLTSSSTENYDKIILKKFTQGINIMKEMECHKCTYKIGEFEYRMCKICKKISHIGCLSITEGAKDNIHGNDYWYCKSCKPCRICLSNISDLTSFTKRTCSACSKCYHQECLNDYIVPLYPLNPVEEKWKCENCLKCVNCDISAKDIVTQYFHNKSPPVLNAHSNNPSSPAQTNLFQSNAISYLKSNNFSNNFKHCENCEKKYHQKEYCPVCRKLWQANDVNMIECKCKYWVHEECDRIFSNDYFQKIKKKNYNCPKCRTEKKNKQIWAIIDELTKLDKFGYFYNPVDTNVLKNYTKIIKKPMCYSFILEKLGKNIYLNNMDELFSDVYLIFYNATTFNMPNSQVFKIAEQLNLNSSQLLEKYYPILYELSFEYFLFDFYSEETGDNSKNILLILEELINNNFSKQVGLLNSKISQIVAKINEYKINWQFLREFMEKNFNCVYVKDTFQILSDKENNNTNEKNNNMNSDSYSVMSDAENILENENYQSSINKIESSNNTAIMFKSAFNEEKITVNNINYIGGDTPVNDINMQIDYIEETYQVTKHAETQQLIQNDFIEKDNKDAAENYIRKDTQENGAMLIEAEYQSQNGDEISMSNQGQMQNVLKSTLHRIDLGHVKEETENDTNNLNSNIKLEILSNEDIPQETNLNTDALPYEDFKNKKRQRTKPRLIKSSEFQHELDTYNSNFELAVKSNNKVTTGSNSNVNHKMEISEYSVDVFNPSIALEEEEDTAIKAYEKSKQSDTKLQFLYFSKYKNYVEQLDNPNEFSDYLDMIMCYVNIKEEKKKKNSIDKEKIAKLKCEVYNENNSCYSDDIYQEPKRVARLKKCRQIKKELEDSNEININTENLKGRERKKSSTKEANNNLNFNSNVILSGIKGNEITSKKHQTNNLTKHSNSTDHTQCKLNIENISRSKTESELFDESINQKSLLPLPTQICFSFSRVDLIFEKNCYLCGSFDDMNQFLSCSVCFENFHSYCISNSPLITSNIENIKKYNWKCQNCKFCECCKQTGNDLLLLYCDSCDRAVHTYCLDSKLHVVPESGWKCLSCFECVNCNSKRYYQPTFPINVAKDYSIFTKNFHYCFECGMKLFHKSMCVKCGKSDFKNCNKDLIYLSNAADWKKYQNKLIMDNDNSVNVYHHQNVVMLNCNICNNMFHMNCLEIDEINLNSYFGQFDKFNCIDCHYKQICKDKYFEATFIKYLEVLKMSFFLMSFNKLISIILKTICKDSNIKLHSKLLKLFLKDNFESLIQDRKMCMFLELIRMDVFLMKDKQALFDENPRKAKTANDLINNTNNCNMFNIPGIQSALKTVHAIEINPRQENAKINPIAIAINKSLKRNKEIKQNLLLIENENFYGYSFDKIEKKNNIPDAYFSNEFLRLSEHTAEENFLSNLKEIEKSVFIDQLRNVKVDFNYTNRISRKLSINNLRNYYHREIKKNKFLYNVNASNNKHSFSLGKKFLIKNIDNDSTNSWIKYLTVFKRRNECKNNCNMTGLTSNNLFSSDSNDNVAMTSQDDIMVVDSTENLKDSTIEKMSYNNDMEKGDKINYSNQSNQSYMFIREKEKINSGSTAQKNKRQRISLIQDKELKTDLKNFFNQENRKKIENTSVNDNTNFINFYNFNIEEYYKGVKSHVGEDNKSISLEDKEILDKTLEKLEPMLSLQTFPKHMQMFVFNIILDAILTLRQSLLKWLLNQMLIISENPKSSPNKTSNSLFSNLINLNLANAALNPQFESIINNASDCTDEEIAKFLDHIDPVQESPNRNTSCEFCQRKGARKFSGRLLYIKSQHWAHVNCILWSKGIQEANDGNIFNVSQVVNKLRQLKCQFCRKYGATVCCDFKKCGKYFHFACAHGKQGVFTDKRQFFCGKCATNAANKEENFADFYTNKRYFIVKNQEFVNDYKSLANYAYVDGNICPDGFKMIPKYLIGTFNKFGNTTVMKFFQMNQKDLNLESIDIALVKYFEKSEKNHTKKSAEEILLLYLLNENGISFSQLSFGKENWKDFEDLLERAKITNCFAKTDIDLNQLRENSKYDILSKNFNGQYNLNLNNSTYAGGNIKTERLDFFNNQTIKRFNINIEDYMTSNILSEEEIKSSKRINKRYNDWLSVMNISIPFNIILKYRTLYLKTFTELSENLTTSTCDMMPEIKNKKEIKNKLENFLSTIKTKNSIDDKQCFRFLNYMETHQQIKFVKKSIIDNDLNNEASKTGEKKVNKANKQTYKNLNRTMSTNIMEMDLPLAMKFRNYKSLRPRVTIGPSGIHRNGLFTTEAFQPGEIVIEYVGELITNKIADFREKEYNLKGFGDCYMFRLDGDHIIDATKYGNLARFINHCCNPNCCAQANQIGDRKHIILYAKRPIKAHEEITYDYNFECEQEKIQCRCGAINCQGRLN